MSEKRRDNKGRILRTGESQRKNGMYEFRYTDANKTRRAIYDMDLVRLRKKEDEIKVMQHDGIDYAGGAITVIQLLERYIKIKRGMRYNTSTGYMFVMSGFRRKLLDSGSSVTSRYQMPMLNKGNVVWGHKLDDLFNQLEDFWKI